jgi:hypothetical protein
MSFHRYRRWVRRRTCHRPTQSPQRASSWSISSRAATTPPPGRATPVSDGKRGDAHSRESSRYARGARRRARRGADLDGSVQCAARALRRGASEPATARRRTAGQPATPDVPPANPPPDNFILPPGPPPVTQPPSYTRTRFVDFMRSQIARVTIRRQQLISTAIWHKTGRRLGSRTSRTCAASWKGLAPRARSHRLSTTACAPQSISTWPVRPCLPTTAEGRHARSRRARRRLRRGWRPHRTRARADLPRSPAAADRELDATDT